ncbi:MAG: LysM peptidoglycan-binding domain-containing protein [Anaerolineae bacterium]|nr:LysM peptidoglycan-binding domain-containing protein [Anaerolineae bacterium]
MRRLTAAAIALVIVMALFGLAVQPAAAQANNVYVVQPGDNLYRISLKFGVSMNDLIRVNGIVNPNFIYAGQRLTLPANAVLPTATTVSVPTASGTSAATQSATLAGTSGPVTGATLPATSAATTVPMTIIPTVIVSPTPVAIPATYTVQPGDNLYRISLKFGVNMFLLAQFNGITNTNVIYVGQVLRIPGGSTQAAAASPTNTAQAPAAGTAAATLAAGTAAATTAPSNTASNVGFAYGVSAFLGVSDPALVVTAVKDLGVNWVKLSLAWRGLEATKGTIDFATLDSRIDLLTNANFKILLTVSAAPDWARNTTTESGPPTDFNDYANFIGAVAARYKGRVQAYEIWNEPNIRREWSGRPLSAASYVELLRLAYNAIKAADSAAIVVSAGLSPTGFNDGVNAIDDRVFLRQAYAAGLASYSDAIGAHPNGWANPPDSTCCNASPGVSGWFNDRSFYFRDTLKDYRDIMTQNNDSGTFIWATEFGWGSSEGVITDPNAIDPNFGFVKFTSQTQQAQYIPRAFELARTMGYVGPMFLSNLNACVIVGSRTDSPDFRTCYFSLLDANGEPRPVYDAVKAARK